MNFVADEGVDKPIVDRLRTDGHSVISIAETAPSISDDEVLAAANRDSAVLITADKDFGELVVRQQRFANGVVLLRLAGLPTARKAELVSEAIGQHLTDLPHSFAVISLGIIRIRPL